MTAGFNVALSRLRPILLPLLLSGIFVTGAFAQSAASSAPAPLYRVAGRTSGKALAAHAAATAPAGQAAPSGRVTTLDRASLTSLATLTKGMAVALPVTDAFSVTGKVNLVRVENGWTRSGGHLDSSTPGTFYLATNGTKVEGFILRPDIQVAYRYETQATGETVLRELPLNSVVCGMLPPFLNDPTAPAKTGTNATGPTTNAVVVPPILNSRATAVATLYLDFDGETVTDPAWDGGNTIVAPPPNVTTTQINQIFARVKEDYWPFNINVTTDVNKYNAAPVGKRMRCIITPNDAAAPGAGGVAYIGSFAEAGQGGFTTTIPCWVFNGGVIGIAEAVSHELGHTFGLYHDGRELPTSGHEEYYLGQGTGATSWCPIMGAAYYVSVSQFSRGEYQYANNQQDDLAIISSPVNGFGYVADEAGDYFDTAAPLTGTSNGAVNQTGVITRSRDFDIFSFTTTGGKSTFSAILAPDPNLDIVLEIYDADFNFVGSSNPPEALPASLSATLKRGIYYLVVTDSGANDPLIDGYSTYGSIGQYTIRGTVPGFGVDLAPNLNFTTLSDINSKLVISNSPGTRDEPQTFYATDDLYLDFSILNNGDVAAIAPATIGIYVDDVLKGTVTTPADFEVGDTSETDDYDIGMLTVGFHTIRLQVDPDNALDETNKLDNTFLRRIYVDLPGPPTIYSDDSVNGQVGTVFFYEITATNQPTSYGADGLPPGLYLKDNTDVITGTPTAIGTYQITVTATNDVGSTSKTVTVNIIAAIPAITDPGLLTGEVGQPFSYQIDASNSPAGYGATSLPPGLTLNRITGIISGTPTQAGTYTVLVQAVNSGGTGTATYTIQILVAAPVFSSPTTAQGRVAKPFSYQIVASNVTGGYGADGLPDGLTIDTTTGLITGTPTVAGTYPVTLSATNDNRTVTQILTLTITQAPPIAAWGLPVAITIPADLDMADVVALSAGAAHSLALKGDGTVEAFGSNSANQLNVPTGLANVVSVSAGAYHNLALRRDGTVVAWGANDQGQATVPTGLTGVVAVAAGLSHSLALREDGTVVAWGSNTVGQSRPPGDLKDVVGIAAGGYHSLAVKGDGTVVGWGSNAYGQATIPPGLTMAKQVAAGVDFSLILKADGSIVPLGSNTAGQLVFPSGLKDATFIAAGGQHALAVRQDGSVVAWGSNSFGESTPPAILTNVALVAAGTTHSLALVQAGAPRVRAALPVAGTGFTGGSLSLVAYGAGTGPVAYQWAHNGVDLANATFPYLELTNLTQAQAGTYTVRLTNPLGTVTSAPATVTISTAPVLPTVTLAATTPQTSVGSSTPGAFTVTRSGDTTTDLLVHYAVTGNAQNGKDYVMLKGTRRMKAGKSHVQIQVKPLGLLDGAASKAVKLTLVPDNNYTVGTTETLKVKILGPQQ